MISELMSSSTQSIWFGCICKGSERTRFASENLNEKCDLIENLPVSDSDLKVDCHQPKVEYILVHS